LSRAKYTLEFKQEAVRQVKAGRPAAVVAKTLGMPSASLTNWVRADAKGQLGVSADGKPAAVVSPEQAEIARLKAEVARPSSTLPSHLPPPSGSSVYTNQQLAIAKMAIFEFFCSANLLIVCSLFVLV